MNRLKAMAAIIVAAVALPVSGALAAPVPVAPNGVNSYNAPVCGRSWVDIHIPRTSYFNAYNDDFGDYTCIKPMRYRLDFQIVKVSKTIGFLADPNISSGWESGRYTCTGHHGLCYKYPVQVARDGNPVASVRAWLAPGTYDFNLDLQTNLTDIHPVQYNGTEVMIWLAYPHLHPDAHGRRGRITIDGIRFGFNAWWTFHHGVRWRLVIFYAMRQRSSAYGLRLNDFFHAAENLGYMTSSYWLSNITAGFELVRGGLHDNIHYLSLTGLHATPGGK